MVKERGFKGVLSRKRAFQILDHCAGAKVLVVGDLMVDHFIWGNVSRISPEAPVPVVEVVREDLLLGGSANVLNNIIAMGGNVSVSGIIGSDDMGRWLIREFGRMGIDTEGIITERNRPTTVKTRIVAHNQQVVRFDREIRKSVHSGNVSRILRYIESIRNDLHAVIISDYNKGVVSGKLLSGIREAIGDRNIVVCADPKQSDFSFYRGVDVITPNHHEAARALGVENINGHGRELNGRICRAAKSLLKEIGLKALLITRGEEGMSLFESDGSCLHIPAVAKEIFDVTGAGDTVIGVFALSAAAGATFKEAAVLANHAAGIVVGKVGTATVSREELKKVL
ncbi:MAG: D-glycero-beta-D-manno-heptose-7-phosphate kinase [Syntrophales bacterium]